MALAVACLVGLAACDTGDGTTLRPPEGGAGAVPTVPIGTLDTAPADEIVAEPVDAVTLAPIPATEAPTLPAPVTDGALELTAPWADGAPIDPRHGCDGSNAAPPLAWNGVPEAAQELAVALVDQSDLSRGRPFVHWALTGLDPALPGLVEDEVPLGARTALNFFGNVGYDGPCPPPGSTHVYELTLFALGQQLEVAEGTPAAEVLDLVGTVAIDQTTVTGSSTR